MTNLISRLAFAALLLPSVVFADRLQDQDYSWDCPGSGHLTFRRNLLVSTGELAQLIESSEVTVVHVGFDESVPGIRRATYSDGHIPGARHLRWSDLKGSGETLRPAEGRRTALAALGLSRGSRVVLYDTGLGLEAAAAFVALESLGLADRAALLDGQGVKWVSEGRPLCRWGEEGPPSDPELQPSGGAMEIFVPGCGQAVTLLDARAGSAGPFLRMPWTGNFAGLSLPVLKSEEELRRRWARVSPRSDTQVVVAARHWREAAHVYFVAKLLGYSVRLYDGSIEELEGSPAALERGL
jgi:thiosulfate/3-mercaptopyruvate sulfurtransferase